MKNYYLILGISPSAQQEEIKIAYRALAKKFHPDINPGSTLIEERFKEISEAYNVLSDEESRRKYDLKFLYAKNATTTQREQRARPKFRKKTDVPLTKKEKITISLMLGGGVSFVAFMAVMSFFIPQYDERKRCARSFCMIKLYLCCHRKKQKRQ